MIVCLVEPNPLGNKLLARVLERAEYRVVSFTDGEPTLTWLSQQHEPIILLSSLDLNDISGHEFVWMARLCAREDCPIYLIALDSVDHTLAAEALDSGADDLIPRPLVMKTVHARMRVAQRTLTLQTRLAHLATHDPLTGLANRRAFFNRLENLCSPQYHGALSLISLDIDYFKSVNDRYGHDSGDMAIVAVANLARDVSEDAARVGGEEFLILMSDTGLDDARRIAEDLRQRIAAKQIVHGQARIGITVSLGVTGWLGQSDTIQAFLSRADEALYDSKKNGRNQVTVRQFDTTAEEQVVAASEHPSVIALRRGRRAGHMGPPAAI